MRIFPVVYFQNNFVNNSKNSHTKFESKNYNSISNSHIHNYTGVASADLAYASLFDSAIARDLKLMGLI